MPNRIIAALKASLTEQSRVEISFAGQRLHGIVTHLDEGPAEEAAVDLRHERGRSVIRIAAIDAVTTE